MRPNPHLSVVSSSPDSAVEREPATLARPWWKDLLWVLALGGALATMVGWLASERRAVLSLEPDARAAVFDDAWAGFQRLCSTPMHTGLVPRCREQARFLLLFPECQGACQEQARLHGRALR
ncbi:hypothetical protein FJV41_07420 [Myxococcus llanfairpwllgwyngyllgogerychwyrndrobwllllantysiliogogogochensis]|uniref:Uncharacterized protein n=1 Tax=Myxococcus llanfairpwllgwyngyllgogerychwyrndrobwllllantysiliogogogochensis TaxID=2590453 RepID=A0A540X5Z0_9BACT|nr:hypothetical protein [Myxococcus llanfairpwllgwyngyllgogerychwyrndrobwllllantysiliogogogochensis]TQF16642.1 hypothetical protein FJV41_07420 [Myxococcus llanfairpwllgwyngyllgogerychwyrndrobwllllantysiliogogogochensis]